MSTITRALCPITAASWLSKGAWNSSCCCYSPLHLAKPTLACHWDTFVLIPFYVKLSKPLAPSLVLDMEHWQDCVTCSASHKTLTGMCFLPCIPGPHERFTQRSLGITPVSLHGVVKVLLHSWVWSPWTAAFDPKQRLAWKDPNTHASTG